MNCVSPALLRLCIPALLVLAFPPSILTAQDTPPSGWGRGNDINTASSSSIVSWLSAWSPIRPITDIPRGMIRAPISLGILDAPPPVIGAFVTAGAPGSLFRDLTPSLSGDTARFSDIRFRYGKDGGQFRRPLDVSNSSISQVTAHGWSPIGSRVILVGKAVIDKENVTESSHSEYLSPYRSSPFIDTDSVSPPMGRSRARFEGALGVALGEFGVGISAAVESREHSTHDFPLRRGGRLAIPAIAAGVERTLPWLNGRVGGYYRWSEPVETYMLNSNPLITTLYLVQGFDEPKGLVVSGLPVLARVESRSSAIGGSVDLTLSGNRIVVSHERGKRAEDQNRSPINAVRPTDRWRATGYETRVAVQRTLGMRSRATVVTSMESLEGEGERSDLTGLAVSGTDSRMAFEADLRTTISPRWRTAISAGATRVTTSRRDYVVTVDAETEQLTPFGAMEVARAFGASAIAVGFSAALTSPAGKLPTPSDQGPNYSKLVAPSLAYDASEARAVAGWITATVPFRGRSLIGSVRSEQTSASSVAAAFLQPSGSRSGWSISIGMR